jgi:DNA polymerase III alpha subunit (gram-positive type)
MTNISIAKAKLTTPVKRAATIIWSHSEMSQADAIYLAKSVLKAALKDDHTAEALWDTDQRAQALTPRPWDDATPEERGPYLESAAEYRDAILPPQAGY